MHLLDKSLNGLFNIDLFIPNKQKEEFLNLAKLNFCIKAIHPVNNHQNIYHLYLLGKDKKFFLFTYLF